MKNITIICLGIFSLLYLNILIGCTSFTNNSGNRTELDDTLYTIKVTDVKFNPESGKIERYFGEKTDIIIPSHFAGTKIKKISRTAFKDKNLRSVYIEDGIKKIGEYAFSSNDLNYVRIPSDVKTIDYGAFAYNEIREISWENINVSDKSIIGIFNTNKGLEKDGIYYLIINDIALITYYNGKEEDTLFIPDSLNGAAVKIIGYEAFIFGKFRSVVIPNSVSCIGTASFRGNRNLENISLPNSIESIHPEAFASTSIDSITIPNSVTEFNLSVFDGCFSLKKINYPSDFDFEIANHFKICKNLVSNDFAYVVVNGEAMITGFIEQRNFYEIPDSLDGYKVNRISRLFPDNCIDTVKLSNNVIQIGEFVLNERQCTATFVILPTLTHKDFEFLHWVDTEGNIYNGGDIVQSLTAYKAIFRK